MKRILLIVILAMAMILTACTGGKEDSEKPNAGGNDSKFAQTSNADSQKEESTSQASQPEESSQTESSKPEESSKPQESSSKPEESSSKPEESSSKPEESSSKPEESSDDNTPSWLKDATEDQKAAYEAAYERYRDGFYSYQGLIDTLYYQDDFDYDDAEWAVDHLDANWYSDALGYANYQLNNTGYSRLSLYDSLDIAEFTEDEIDYAMENCAADWAEEAAEMAYLYADQVPSSRADIREFLTNHGFTEYEIGYGIENSGIDWYEEALRVANYRVFLYPNTTEYGVKMQFLDGDWEPAEIEYALANVDVDYNQNCLEHCYQLLADNDWSKAYLRDVVLYNETWYAEQVDYAMANLECNWELEAVGAAWIYLDDYPDCTHDELHNYLVSDALFTEEEADYACNYVGK